MPPDLSAIRAVTFDCYGTLIDWETGIVNAVTPVLAAHGVHWDRPQILAAYSRLERQAESGPYAPYRDVLTQVMHGLAALAGVTLTAAQSQALWRSLPQWPAYPDTALALRAIKERYRIGVLSNVDRDLFAATAPALGVPLDVLVTAEDVHAYKPAPAHFLEGLRRVGLPADRVLHAAESPVHDLGVARKLGMPTAWVRRRQGDGPTASGTAAVHADIEAPDMASLARRLLESA